MGVRLRSERPFGFSRNQCSGSVGIRTVDREIARLTYECEPPLQGPEVAERTGVPAGTVRNRLVQIRRLLAELLETPPE